MRVGELGRNIHWAVYDVEPADQKMELENRFWSQFFRYDSQNHTKGEFLKERMRTRGDWKLWEEKRPWFKKIWLGRKWGFMEAKGKWDTSEEMLLRVPGGEVIRGS